MKELNKSKISYLNKLYINLAAIDAIVSSCIKRSITFEITLTKYYKIKLSITSLYIYINKGLLYRFKANKRYKKRFKT